MESLPALAVVAAVVALPTFALLRLNRRDRRRDALQATLGVCLRELGLRGMIAVQVSIGVWPGGARVTLDMRLCAAQHVWQVIDRVHPVLPRGATLRVVASSPCRAQPSSPFHRAVVAVL
ncbi:MAG: hypothetical protein DMD76_22835 [Candidatus Rokuibacteriota bacterium]|nr:MAG: hypothetical protein DMD76_22835 [Candidatus Rokubacteria bacterium]